MEWVSSLCDVDVVVVVLMAYAMKHGEIVVDVDVGDAVDDGFVQHVD